MHGSCALYFSLVSAIFWIAGLSAFWVAFGHIRKHRAVIELYRRTLGQAKDDHEQLVAAGLARDADWTEGGRAALLKLIKLPLPGTGTLFSQEVARYLSGKGRLTILGQRLLFLASSAKEKKGSRFNIPLNSLSLFTRDYELNRGSVIIMKTATLVLLVCGICGTMWCVSAELESLRHQPLASLISAMGECLLPSAIAMLGYLVLRSIAGYWQACFERTLYALDALTIQYLEPVFLPVDYAGKLNRNMNRCSQLLNSFQAPGWNSDARALSDNLQTLFNGMEGYVESVNRAAPELTECLSSACSRCRILLADYLKLVSILHNIPGLLLSSHQACVSLQESARKLYTAVDSLGKLMVRESAVVEGMGGQGSRTLKALAVVSGFSASAAAIRPLLQEIAAYQPKYRDLALRVNNLLLSGSSHAELVRQHVSSLCSLVDSAIQMLDARQNNLQQAYDSMPPLIGTGWCMVQASAGAMSSFDDFRQNVAKKVSNGVLPLVSGWKSSLENILDSIQDDTRGKGPWVCLLIRYWNKETLYRACAFVLAAAVLLFALRMMTAPKEKPVRKPAVPVGTFVVSHESGKVASYYLICPKKGSFRYSIYPADFTWKLQKKKTVKRQPAKRSPARKSPANRL